MAYDGSLKFDTKVDDKGFKKGINRLKTIGTKTLDVVKKSAVASAAAITGIGAASIKMGSDFESAMARVGALSGATGKDFKKLEQTAMELGKTTVFSASDAAEGMQYLAMAGYKTNDIVSAMPGLLNAAAAGQTDLGVAADITSNILSGFGLEAKETTKVADVLTLAFTSSNTSLESLGETMKYAAPVARAAGFSLEETAAAAGILGDAGIQGSMAGTALRGVMLRLVNPPKQAADALDALGVSVVDSSGKIKPLHQIIKELEKATEGMTDAQKTAIISQIAGQNAASGLLAIMDAGPESLKNFTEELEKAGGTAEEVANRQLDNLQGDLKLLGSVLETTGINIYNHFQKPLRNVVQGLTQYIEEIANTINAHEDIENSLSEMGATVHNVGIELHEVPTGFESVVVIVGDMLADMVTKVAQYAPKMIKTASNLMIAFIGGIRSNMPAIIDATVSIVTSMLGMFIEVLPQFLILGLELITQLIQGMVEALPQLIEQTQTSIMMLVESIVENLPLILESGIQIMIMLIQGIAEMLPMLITQTIDLIIALCDTIIENIDLIIEAGIQIVTALIEGIITNLPKLIEQVPRIINAFFDAIVANLPTILEAGWEIIKMLVKGIIESIPIIIKNIPQIIKAIVNVLIMYNWWNLGKSIITWLKDGIMSMPGQIAQAGRNIAKSAWESIKGVFQGAPKLGQGFVRHIVNGIKGLGSNLINAAKNLGRSAINAIKFPFKSAKNLGTNLVKGIWNGINDVTGWIIGKIKGFGDSVMSAIKGIFGIHSPSKWMRDEIGKNLVLGIGVGIEDETPGMERELEAMARKMQAAVEIESSNIGTQMTGRNASDTVNRHIIENNDYGVTQNVTIVNPERTPSENARELKRVGKELALGY